LLAKKRVSFRPFAEGCNLILSQGLDDTNDWLSLAVFAFLFSSVAATRKLNDLCSLSFAKLTL